MVYAIIYDLQPTRPRYRLYFVPEIIVNDQDRTLDEHIMRVLHDVDDPEVTRVGHKKIEVKDIKILLDRGRNLGGTVWDVKGGEYVRFSGDKREMARRLMQEEEFTLENVFLTKKGLILP